MKHAAMLVSGLGFLVSATPAGALVLCAGANGALIASSSCRPGSTQIDPAALGLVGPPGPQGPAGPQGSSGPAGVQGPAGPVQMFANRNFEDVATNSFPGVTVASLSLPPATHMLFAKLRYRNNGTTTQTASCIFQGLGIGDLDGSQQNVPPGGEQNGQVDGVLMDIVIKRPGDDPNVHLQCFGPADGSVHIINAQFLAIPPTMLTLQ